MAFKPLKNILGSSLTQGMSQTNSLVNNLSGSSGGFQNPYKQQGNQGGFQHNNQVENPGTSNPGTITPQDNPYQGQGWEQGGGAGAMNDGTTPPQPTYDAGFGMEWQWNGSSWTAGYIDIGSIDFGDPNYEGGTGGGMQPGGASSGAGYGSQQSGVTPQGEGIQGGLNLGGGGGPNSNPGNVVGGGNFLQEDPNADYQYSGGGGGSTLGDPLTGDFTGDMDVNQDGLIDFFDIMGGLELGWPQDVLQLIANNITGNNPNLDLPGSGDVQQSEASNQFAGGGGRGGTESKKLLYPSSSGGFTSVGSGISGSSSKFEELLKSIMEGSGS